MLLVVDRMKGQASFEIMMLIAFLIIISTFYITAFRDQFQTFYIDNQNKLEVICADLADEINSAVSYGNGFTSNTTLPSQINGQNYKILVQSNSSMICILNNLTAFENILSKNITNQTSIPPFYVPIREIKVENINDVIVIS